MKLFHSSYEEITKISAHGRFGSFLFFSSEPSHYGSTVYSIEIDESDIIDCNSFFYRDDWELLSALVQEVMEIAGCDEDEAQEYLSQRAHHDDAEIDWDIQRLTAKAAKVLGFRAVEVPDEHGASYMIDMLGRESDLVKV